MCYTPKREILDMITEYFMNIYSISNFAPFVLQKSMRKVCGDHTTDIINKWYSKRKCSELYKCYLHNISDLNLKLKVELKIINHSMLCYRCCVVSASSFTALVLLARAAKTLIT